MSFNNFLYILHTITLTITLGQNRAGHNQRRARRLNVVPRAMLGGNVGAGEDGNDNADVP